MNMGDSIEIRPKGLLRGHPKISKKSKGTLIGSKLKEICLVKVDLFFAKLSKVIIDQICIFSKGAHVFLLETCV